MNNCGGLDENRNIKNCIIFFFRSSLFQILEMVELDSVLISKEKVKFYVEYEEYCCSMLVLRDYLDLKPCDHITEDDLVSILPLKTTILRNNRTILILDINKEASNLLY